MKGLKRIIINITWGVSLHNCLPLQTEQVIGEESDWIKDSRKAWSKRSHIRN
jgi:hypothetical protein